ncbi:MAG: molybdopterin molybdenumtransferase MoeA [Polynucleobacter sp. 24-46-87]|jgi:molybdopterin molybdotransferase|uniref:molybdopterin molybdotransferase MoeA n=1 Tax=Polynucleobacter sp. 39-46-10 TaxID=1970428 RepID=UPI000BD4674C|nr:gephyrin-like molybdotransferase Glp [Polynucleobacter sp. 39-46-10]OZA15640.1 MAG: molybdopterin molybdenumtransferase MoeA [Polynucleobacter sp. 24-46-87]OZA77658.1 MAG: molybdopterin molybdenumtransferase MoeA [Polynucleobacter sp. 39-46-10]
MSNLKHIPSSDPIYTSGSLHVEQARIAISDLVKDLITESQKRGESDAIECIALDQAINRILAKDLLSPIDVPVADNSAMDGFAFHGDCLGNSEDLVTLKVVGTAYAGKPYEGVIASGECLKIMTGALMPSNCDTVIPQEFTEPQSPSDGTLVSFKQNRVKRGENRRLRGEDLQSGKPAISAGRLLRPSDLGLAASLGISELQVHRKLRVAILSSGDELRRLGQALEAGNIYDSNRYSLIGLLKRLDLEIIDCGIVRDDPASLKVAFIDAASKADVLISSGGVSAGEADFTKQIMQELGDVGFWKIAMRPGRPMAFGMLRPTQGANHKTLFFGLPGNPVAVMVTFYQFVRSALLQLNGASQTEPPLMHAIAEAPIRKRPGRTEYQRAILGRGSDGKPTVKLTGSQGAGILRSMSEANCFVILSHDQGNVASGDWVDVALFDGLL